MVACNLKRSEGKTTSLSSRIVNCSILNILFAQHFCIVGCSLHCSLYSTLACLQTFITVCLYLVSLLSCSLSQNRGWNRTWNPAAEQPFSSGQVLGRYHRQITLLLQAQSSKPSFTINSDLKLLVSFIGVPVWSFDTVSIDSDLDSVCTEQVRQHIHRRSGERLQKKYVYIERIKSENSRSRSAQTL